MLYIPTVLHRAALILFLWGPPLVLLPPTFPVPPQQAAYYGGLGHSCGLDSKPGLCVSIDTHTHTEHGTTHYSLLTGCD